MAIVTTEFVINEKKQLTADVFELELQSALLGDTQILPGQYVLFILPSGKRRAYSIAYSQASSSSIEYRFIIKRLSHEGAGSAELCDLEVGSKIRGMVPLGHFVLSDGDIPRMFIGTGTGFAPLYFQIRALESRGFSSKTHFAFGVRYNEDVFYQDEFNRLKSLFQNFSYTQYLSKGTPGLHEKKGYVGAEITQENIQEYQEFYICGSPAMVKEVREKLASFLVSPEKIRFEQF